MTLQQLKYVVMIANKKTLSEAAKALYLSQPSLTKAVKQLEKELGVTLFIRTNKGIVISHEGDQFLSYARQVLDQVTLLEEHYFNHTLHTPKFSVSCQHYSFAVKAFVDVITQFDGNQYDFTLRETQTNEIIEDVGQLKSEVGVLYLCEENERVLRKMFNQYHLVFEELYITKPHVFISLTHPLAKQDFLTLEDLAPYPYLSFEQGAYNSFYYAEEMLSTYERNKNIKVRDRATLFNLLIGLDGYTISSGIMSTQLDGESIIAKPLTIQQLMRIGIIRRKGQVLTPYAQAYITYLKEHLQDGAITKSYT